VSPDPSDTLKAQPSTPSHDPTAADTASGLAELPLDTIARLVQRLSTDIKDLTREVSLREGQLLEQQQSPVPVDADQLRRAREGIERSQHCLRTTEIDLVALEAVLRQRGPQA
jgi:hypothetical protein